jgi:hypothetical protein
MVRQLLPNTNEMLQYILALQNLDLNTVEVAVSLHGATASGPPRFCIFDRPGKPKIFLLSLVTLNI